MKLSVLSLLGLCIPMIGFGAWTRGPEVDGVIHLYNEAGQIERYDLEAREWQAGVSMGQPPAAVAISGSRIYYGTGKSLYRMVPDGTEYAHVRNFSAPIQTLFVDEDYGFLLVGFSSGGWAYFEILDLDAGTLIQSSSSFNASSSGSSYAPGMKAFFGVKTNSSQLAITKTAYDAEGLMTHTTGNSMVNFRASAQTWVFPDESLVASDGGMVHRTDNLQYIGTMAGGIRDLAFDPAGNPVALTDSQLVAYGADLLPVGFLPLPFTAFALEVVGEDILLFVEDANEANGIRVETRWLKDLGTVGSDELTMPPELPVSADDYFVDHAGIVYLFSKDAADLRRYDARNDRWLSGLTLPEGTRTIAWDATSRTLYTASADGTIFALDLNTGLPVFKAFAVVPADPVALVVAGDYLIVRDRSDSAGTTRVYARSTGEMVDSRRAPGDGGDRYTWSGVWSRLYYVPAPGPAGIRYNPLSTEGILGTGSQTGMDFSINYREPLLLSPDEQLLLSGGGVLFHTSNLARAATLTNGISGGCWTESGLYTVLNTGSYQPGGQTKVQKWGMPTFEPQGERIFTGRPLGIVADGSVLIVILEIDANIRLIRLDASLEILSVSELGVSESDQIDFVQDGLTHQLTWDPSLFDADAQLQLFRINVPGEGDQSLGLVPAAPGFAILDPSEPGLWEYEVKTLAKVVEKVSEIVVNQTSQIELECLNPSSQGPLDLYARAQGSAEWSLIGEITESSPLFILNSLAPYDAYEFELRHLVRAMAQDPEPLLSSQWTLHLNWLRPSHQTTGFRLEALVGEEWSTLTEFGAETFSASYSPAELPPEAQDLRLFSLEGSQAHPHPMQWSRELALQWAAVDPPPADGFVLQVEDGEGLWNLVTTIPGEATSLWHQWDGPYLDFPPARVLRVIGSEPEVYPADLRLQVRSVLDWGTPRDYFHTARYRTAPDAPWNRHYIEGSLGPVEHLVDGASVPYYEFLDYEIIPAQTIGQATVLISSETIESAPLLQWDEPHQILRLWVQTSPGATYILQHSLTGAVWSDTGLSATGTGGWVHVDYPAPDGLPLGLFRFLSIE